MARPEPVDPLPVSTPPRRLLLDVLALALLTVGFGGLLWLAFAWSVPAGLAVLCAYAVLAGGVLATDLGRER